MAKNSYLQVLFLHWNKLQPKGGLAIAKALQENQSLQVLDVSYCSLGPKSEMSKPGNSLDRSRNINDLLNTSQGSLDNSIGSIKSNASKQTIAKKPKKPKKLTKEEEKALKLLLEQA